MSPSVIIMRRITSRDSRFYGSVLSDAIMRNLAQRFAAHFPDTTLL
jgi:hypothetical protein